MGADLFVLAHGAPISLPSGRITLVPLGLTLLALGLCRVGGRRVVEALRAVNDPLPRRDLLIGTGSFVVVYAGLTGLAAVVAGSQAARPLAAQAALGAAVVAGVAAGLPAAWSAWPAGPGRDRAAVLATATVRCLVGLGAAGARARAGRAGRRARPGDGRPRGAGPGRGGQRRAGAAAAGRRPRPGGVGPGLAGRARLRGRERDRGAGGRDHAGSAAGRPAARRAARAGHLVGSGRSAWPPSWSWSPAAPSRAGPPRAGARRRGGATPPLDVLAVAGVVTVVVLVLAAAASGSVGPGRMAEVGPAPVLTAAVVGLEVLVGGAVGTLLAGRRVSAWWAAAGTRSGRRGRSRTAPDRSG